MELSRKDFEDIMRHCAEEINVKQITIGGVIVYDELLLKDKYREKQDKFESIYGKS